MEQADGSTALAHRLRELREGNWPDVKITQRRLAQALGVSVPLISSWEGAKAVPPVDRLDAYAMFFATRRSIESEPFALLHEADLTDAEGADRDELRRELLALRDAAEAHGLDGSPVDPKHLDPWQFADDHRVTIVCGQVPPEEVPERVRFAGTGKPDFTEMYTYADLDALFELHGHIRAVNPTSQVNIRVASRLVDPDRYADHMVLLGGVDWNAATREFLRILDLPVSQVERDEDPDGWFEVSDREEPTRFHPVLAREAAGEPILREDVAHFFRAPNPFNHERTVTICNGMFSRGVLGAVRALTDERFRDRNADYLRGRFRGGVASVLFRVLVTKGVVVLTPDWTLPDTVLHEWPVEDS